MSEQGFAADVNTAVREKTREVRSGVLTVAAGTGRHYNDSGRTVTVTRVRASVGVAPGTGPVTVDVNKNGTTIFPTQSQRPAIAVGQFTAVVNAPAGTTLADGDYLTVDVDTIGTTPAGSDLAVEIVLA